MISEKVNLRFYLLTLFSLLFNIQGQSQRVDLSAVDSLISIAIDSSYFPGAQILVASNSSIIYHKAYGYHTYAKQNKVNLDNLYDLASVTKIISGLPILMQLESIGQFDHRKSLANYSKQFRNTNKKDLTFKSVLAHQAGLHPYFVFWKEAQKENEKWKRRTFKNKKSWRYPIKITDNLFAHRKFKNRIYNRIIESDIDNTPSYKYSGLFFIILPDIIKDITGLRIDEYYTKSFLSPLGIDRLTYNPLSKFSKSEIIPTERDTFFRNQLVHGTVHDENAAILGGISCNAGLFGNAESVYTILQMYLNEGSLHSHKYIDPNVLRTYTSYQFEENRRGLGFDKPPIDPNNSSYICASASPESYGHSGYTGTFVWVDPKYDLIVILLTNRVHPTRDARGLYTSNFRPRLHQLIYDIILSQD